MAATMAAFAGLGHARVVDASTVTASSPDGTGAAAGAASSGNAASVTDASLRQRRKPKTRRSLKSFFLPPASSSLQGSNDGSSTDLITGQSQSVIPAQSSQSVQSVRSAPVTPTLPLPADVILSVASLLPPSSLLNFILVSSSFHELLLPSLYHTLILSSSYHVYTVLPRLALHNQAKSQTLCSYIHALVLKPNYYLSWPRKDKRLDEKWVSGLVEKVARRGWLKNLEWFEWEGLEVPEDTLWEALRMKCPRLTNISTNVGKKLVNPESKLFDFSNLTSFSLIVRHNVEDTPANAIAPVVRSLPPKFWDMIITRCASTLVELTICSFSPDACTFDLGPLMSSIYPSSTTRTALTTPTTRFPLISCLTLGSFGYQLPEFNIPTDPSSSLGEFLTCHPTMTYLRVLWNFKRWVSPVHVPLFSTTFPDLSPQPSDACSTAAAILPKLDTFIGISQQLFSIPLSTRKHIQAVDLTCEPIYEARAEKVCEALKTVEALRMLDLWVHVPPHTSASGTAEQGGENGERRENGGWTDGFFAQLVDSCMGLEELHFMCTTPFTKKHLTCLLAHLKRLPSLKRFSLTKGHTYSTYYRADESMFDSAVRVVSACKAVKSVCIRWARETCLNHLKKEGIYEVVERSEGEIVLVGNERGLPLIGAPFEKRFRRRVLPPV